MPPGLQELHGLFARLPSALIRPRPPSIPGSLYSRRHSPHATRAEAKLRRPGRRQVRNLGDCRSVLGISIILQIYYR